VSHIIKKHSRKSFGATSDRNRPRRSWSSRIGKGIGSFVYYSLIYERVLEGPTRPCSTHVKRGKNQIGVAC